MDTIHVVCPVLMHARLRQFISVCFYLTLFEDWSFKTYIIQYGGPAFHGYTLEHCQHSNAYVVKTCDPVVGTFPIRFTLGRVGTLETARRTFLCYGTWGYVAFSG